MVMGGDSRSEGRRFEFWHCILDGHFFTFICCKKCNDACLKRPKINDKRGRGWPIFILKLVVGPISISLSHCSDARECHSILIKSR